MSKTDDRKVTRLKRKRRIRKKISGTVARPRLAGFRSTRHIYGQIIDDAAGRTLAAASTLSPELKGKLGRPQKGRRGQRGGQAPG